MSTIKPYMISYWIHCTWALQYAVLMLFTLILQLNDIAFNLRVFRKRTILLSNALLRSCKDLPFFCKTLYIYQQKHDFQFCTWHIKLCKNREADTRYVVWLLNIRDILVILRFHVSLIQFHFRKYLKHKRTFWITFG